MKFHMTEADYDRLNPPILDRITDEETGKQFVEEIFDDKWLPVGYIPTPTTRLGWFTHHLIHGLAMRYPLFPVLIFAWRHSDQNAICVGVITCSISYE